MKRILAAVVLLSLVALAQDSNNNVLVERIGNTGFVQLQAESFKTLDPKQQELAYWLAQASIAIDPIIYDQLSQWGVRQKRLLEGVVSHPSGIDAATMAKITEYAKLFWGNRGNHNENTAQKFLPNFTYEELQKAAAAAQRNGAFKSRYGDLPPLATPAALNRELEELRPSIFDATFEPMTTAKTPKDGKDIIQASSNTFYLGVTLADLQGFKEMYPLTSRVVKGADGQLKEIVYRAGTPDGKVPAGLYATYLKKTIGYLEKARAAASPDQGKVIADLIHFYQTGEFEDWLKFGADWVQNNATVDFANGFIEVYRDARAAKGSSQSFVSITDKKVTDAMIKLAQNAEYFEQKAPWAPQYKKHDFKPPVVKAVETIIEAGDFHVTTVGDNLPNENEIREKYGTKNFLFTGSARALADASGYKSLEEFAASPEIVERGKKYGTEASDLLTAMHEVIGHGSGKLSERMSKGSEAYLKEYYSTMEEGRADLMALWNVWDPKLKELGLISNQQEVAKAMYDSQALTMLTQLRRIPRGDTIEEDHQRDRQMIARYIMEKTGAIREFTRDGKHYVEVTDYQKMHDGVGMLLAEVMRTKAEGDYNGIKALVDTYGVHFDPKVRDEIVERYRKLNLPTYWVGINPELNATMTSAKVASVSISYPRDAVRQYLRYASMYDPSVAPAPAKAAGKAASQPKKKGTAPAQPK